MPEREHGPLIGEYYPQSVFAQLEDLGATVEQAVTKNQQQQVVDHVRSICDYLIEEAKPQNRATTLSAVMRVLGLPEKQGDIQINDVIEELSRAFPAVPAEQLQPSFLKPESSPTPTEGQAIPEMPEIQVEIVKLDTTIVPPDELEINAKKKARQEPAQEKPYISRFQLALQVLQELGVDLKQCKFYEGQNSPTMARELSYRVIVIPDLKKTILLCDESDNRSFVIYNSENYEQYIAKTKQELLALKSQDMQDLIWSDPKTWKENLKQLLSKDKASEMQINIPKEQYYRDPDIVRHDLEAYAKALNKTVEQLNTDNIQPMRVVCQNGESVLGDTYIRRAGIALGLAKDKSEARGKMLVILNELKKRAGYEIKEIIEYPSMDAAYFSKENVKSDLKAYAKITNVSVKQLSTYNISLIRVICQNGESVQGHTYISRAGVALGLAKDKSEARGKKLQILNELKKIAGYEYKEIIEYPSMDPAYFSTENVKRDLEAYAKAIGKTGPELIKNNIVSTYITCINGEFVAGATYINRAGVALGLAKTSVEAQNKQKEIINNLKRLAGFEVVEYHPMDALYFSKENIKSDLEAYAKVLDKTVEQLSTRNIKSIRVVCQNGESVLGDTYIRRAGIALGLAKDTKEAEGRTLKILNELKKRGGFIKE